MNTLLQLLLVTTLIAAFILLRIFTDRLSLRSRTRHSPIASDCKHTGCMRSCDKGPANPDQNELAD